MGSYYLIMASESMLETIAQHESALMADLEGARVEVRQIVEAAHAASATTLQESNVRLDEDVSKLRRDAAQARETERARIQGETAARVEQIRKDSADKTSAVRDELVARIIPCID